MSHQALQRLRDGLPWGQEAQVIINKIIELIRDASTTVQGIVRLATDAEAQAKTLDSVALTPDNLAAIGASTTFSGLIEIATDAEAAAVTATDKALVPSNFASKAGQQTYVEGTFTPTLSFGGGSTGITYSAQIGNYTRIGRVVHIELQFTLSNKGSSTGNMLISGLPITATTSMPMSLTLTAVTAGVGDTMLEATVVGGTTTLLVRKTAAGALAILTDADFTNTTLCRIHGSYRV